MDGGGDQFIVDGEELDAQAEAAAGEETASQAGGQTGVQKSNGESAGSTGRTEPVDLKEQLAMEQVKSDPSDGSALSTNMTDARWPASRGWIKIAQNVNGVEIHWVRNTITGAVDDFKFQ
jgi:hypothetical protein